MSVLFSRQCEYALQAVLLLAKKPQGHMTSISELARRLKIPQHFLAKILQKLTRRGLLDSAKGPNGGFALGMPSEDITLFHIVDVIDGPGFTGNCVLGFPSCSDGQPCSLHHQWKETRDLIYSMLVSRNVSQMGADTKKPGYDVSKE